jgi:transposase-like protein
MEDQGRKKRKITAEEKLEIFLEAQRSEITKAEVMRRHGLHSAELSRIEKRARESMIEGFKRDKRKKDPEKEALTKEIDRLKEALTEQSVEVTLLRKKVNGV